MKFTFLSLSPHPPPVYLQRGGTPRLMKMKKKARNWKTLSWFARRSKQTGGVHPRRQNSTKFQTGVNSITRPVQHYSRWWHQKRWPGLYPSNTPLELQESRCAGHHTQKISIVPLRITYADDPCIVLHLVPLNHQLNPGLPWNFFRNIARGWGDVKRP